MATTPPPINPSPRAKFMALADSVKKHHDMLDSQEFERAIHYSLLEYQRSLCEQKVDMTGAAANHFKLVGAQEFVHQLRYLAEPFKPNPVPVSGNLIHQ